VALFRTLAGPTRLAMVRSLAAGAARVVDLTGRLGFAQSTVSKYLACLRGCRLVEAARAAGPWSILCPARTGESWNFMKWVIVANNPNSRHGCSTVT